MKKTDFFGFVSLLPVSAMVLLTSCKGGETASTPEAAKMFQQRTLLLLF